MNTVSRLLDLYCALAKFLAVLCLVVMVVLVFGNVVLRYGFSSGITVSEELSRWCLVWLTFFGALVALRQHRHLGVDSLVVRLPVAGRRICLAICQCAMIYVSYLMLAGSWRQTLITASDTAPASGISVAWFYSSGVFFGISAMAVLAFDLFRTVSGAAGADELVAVRDSEEG